MAIFLPMQGKGARCSGSSVERHHAPRVAAAGHTLALLALVATLAGGGACNRKGSTGTATGAVARTDCEGVSNSLPFKFESANYWGRDLTILKDQHDMQACAKACADNPDCKVASFSGPDVGGDWTNTCVLRRELGDRHSDQPGICSWVKPTASH